MTKKEIEATIQRYEKRMTEFGKSPEALGWFKNRSELRFEILQSRWELSQASVLDFGCGFGDLYRYLTINKELDIQYMGIDINPNLIAAARQEWPEIDFRCSNLLTDSFSETVEYIFASGVFNFQLADNYGFVARCFERFSQIAQKGFAVNFLSNQVDYQLEHTFHADPAKILSYAYQYSRNVVLRNDYMPFEFTVFVDLSEAVDPQYTVFESYRKFIA